MGGWLVLIQRPPSLAPSPLAPSDVYLLLLLRDAVGDKTCGSTNDTILGLSLLSPTPAGSLFFPDSSARSLIPALHFWDQPSSPRKPLSSLCNPSSVSGPGEQVPWSLEARMWVAVTHTWPRCHQPLLQLHPAVFVEQFAFCFPSECRALGTATDHLVATNHFQSPGKETGSQGENPKAGNGASGWMALDPAPHRSLCRDLSVHSQIPSAHPANGSAWAHVDPSVHKWAHPCTRGSTHVDPSIYTWICSCKHGSARANMDLPCKHGSAHAYVDPLTHSDLSVLMWVCPCTRICPCLCRSITHMYADIYLPMHIPTNASACAHVNPSV